MKKSMLILPLLLIILAIVVYATYTTTSAKWVYVENASESYNGSIEEVLLHEINFSIDGDWTTYTLGNVTLFRNYTKLGDNYDSMASSLWQIKYNATGGSVTTTNHSIPAACWNYKVSKLVFKVNMTHNASDGTGTNAHYCYNNTDWQRIGAVQTEVAVYEEAMWWNITGRTYNISYNIVIPDNYTTYDTTTVNFTLNINDTDADINHTTFNCSVYTRMNHTAAYTWNTSSIVYNNTDHGGVTVTFAGGDRGWWHWNCEDNYSRTIINLSSAYRIFDIDLVYYKLSLGINKVINLSLDSGEIVTKGGVTAANLTLVDGTITSTIINITADGDLSISGNLTIGEKITFALGEVIDNIVDGVIAITGRLDVSGSVEGDNLTLISGEIKNPLMNLTSDGELSVGGGIIGVNYTAGSSAGLSMQLNLTGCNVTLTGGIFTAYTGANCAVS